MAGVDDCVRRNFGLPGSVTNLKAVCLRVFGVLVPAVLERTFL